MIMVAMVVAVIMMMAVVVVMAVIMVVMAMIVVVAMIMVVMVAMSVMRMRLRGLVSAAFRLEWPFDLANLAAKTFQHVGDDMVAPYAQPGRADFGFEMPVAKVPGKTHQMAGIAAAHLMQRFRFRHDFNQPTIIEHEGVAMGEGGAFGEINKKGLAADRRDCAAPPPPVLEIEDDAVGKGLAGQRGSGNKGVGVMHGLDPAEGLQRGALNSRAIMCR